MKTMILTCSRDGRYSSGYVSGLIDSMSSPYFGGWLRMESESDIARGRSKLMHKALGQSIDSWLWVDDDIAFRKTHFEQICSVPAEVVGGLYVKRHKGKSVVYNELLGDELPGARDVVTVKEIGTGFLRVTRKAIERMDALGLPKVENEWVHYFNAGVQDDGTYLSEDYAFCKNAWASGTKVYLHRECKVGHHGAEVFMP